MRSLVLLVVLSMLVLGPIPGGWRSGPAAAHVSDGGDGDDRDDGEDRDGDATGMSVGEGGRRESGGPSAPRPGARYDSASELLDALGALFGAAVAEGRDVAPRELLGYGLAPEDLAALAGAGFPALSSETLGALGQALHRLQVPATLGIAEALEAARAAAPGGLIDFNHLYAGGGAGRPCPERWAVRLPGLDAMGQGACARVAPVATIDAAIDVRHPALRGAEISRRSFLSRGLTPAPADHGAAVAPRLVCRVDEAGAPLAPGARLLAAETVLMRGDRSVADAAAAIRGLDWALGQGARVVAMSIEGRENVATGAAVAAVSRGVNLIAAAGNGGASGPPAFPGAFPEAIAVAAVDDRRRARRRGTRGGHGDLAAPGLDVPSAAPGDGVSAWTGTSFAVPFAMAAALGARALTRGDVDAARALLARVAEDIGAPGRDAVSGHGLARAPGPRCWWSLVSFPRRPQAPSMVEERRLPCGGLAGDGCAPASRGGGQNITRNGCATPGHGVH